MKSRVAVIGLALAAASALAACGSDKPSVSQAKEQFCKDVAAVAQDAAAVKKLDATSTVDDAKTAVSNLKSAMETAKSAAKEVGQAEADALQTAYSGLQSSISSISGSDTLGEAAPAVVKARDTFVAQWDAITSKNCGGAATSLSPTTT